MSATEESSKFGFKDQAKAEETLKLLEEHDLAYRKLTVRGLLGRAKRVLGMTKAADKIANIKAAMEVFEKWQLENTTEKNTKTDPSEKVDTVAGLGFKDKEAAEKTLQILEGRDPDYQKLAIRGLLGNAKRVLGATKAEDKIAAIKAGVAHLESFLETFEAENRSQLNLAYLPADVVTKATADYQPGDKLAAEFVRVYSSKPVNGNYKHLRTLFPSGDDTTSWDIVRNRALAKLKKDVTTDTVLFEASGKPSSAHLELVQWAWSPSASKLKEWAAKQTIKRKSDAGRGSSSDSSDAESTSDNDSDSPKRRKVE